MKLSKGWIIAIAVVAFIFIMIMSSVGMYNKMVNLNQDVKRQWGDVEGAYQRRTDLIPNLVNTVKGVANFEKSTLTDVVQARANATAVKIDPSNMTPESLKKFEGAQNGLSSSLSRLMVVVEKYPELKATQNFMELQSQLEGTENRINVERRKFNEVAKSYNANILSFPNVIFARMFGFQEKAYFEAQAGAEKAPEVKF